MKAYVVYDSAGVESTLLFAVNINKAEKKAKKLFGSKAMVLETEVSKEEEKNGY